MISGSPEEMLRRLWESPPHPNTDCSEIAEDMLAAFPDGRLVAFRAADGLLKVLERGEVRAYEYHVVYVRGGLVYDPRHGGEPVPYGEYLAGLRALNDGPVLEGQL